ncbi:MAG: sigma-70 family RNA polymerase sigma factor [Verrucomicrobiota bacterium]
MDAFDRNKHDQFLQLYVENEESLRGFVRSLVPTLEDAREVMQQTASILWRKFDELDSQENFRPWAFGVARFEALSFRRDRARDRHFFSSELMSLLEAEAALAGEESSNEERALEQCLRKLPRGQRSLVESAYVPGVRIDELAKEAGRTPMSLYKALHRIRMALADCIGEWLKRDQEEGMA